MNLIDKKMKEVLETPQVHLFKHENVFGNSFKDEIYKNSQELYRSSMANETSIIPTTPISPINHINGLYLNSFISNAPKKNILYRTTSENETDIQKQDSLKFIESESINSNFYSSQNSSNTLTLSPESIKTVAEFPNTNEVCKTNNFNCESNIKRKSVDTDSKITNSSKEIKMNSLHISGAVKSTDYIENSNKTDLIETNKLGIHQNHMKSARSSSITYDEFVCSDSQNYNKKTNSKKPIMLNTDQRKQQIRNSNREAARRCRERRRNYIETLENNIRSLENRQKNLINENTSLQKENSELKNVIADRKSTDSADLKKLNKIDHQICTLKNSMLGATEVPLTLTLKIPQSNLSKTSSKNEQNQIKDVSFNDSTEPAHNQAVQSILNALISNNLINQNKNGGLEIICKENF